MTVIRLGTEEALFKDLSQKTLVGVCEETGTPHIRSGYWLRQSKGKESSRHSPYYVFCIDNIKSDKPQGQQKKPIMFSYAVVQMYLPNLMCRKFNAKDGSVRHGTFMRESRAPEGSNGCHYYRRWLLIHRSSGLSHTLMRHSPLILDF